MTGSVHGGTVKSVTDNGLSDMILRVSLSREMLAGLARDSTFSICFQTDSSMEKDDSGSSGTYAEAVSLGARRSDDSFAFPVIRGSANVVGEEVGEYGFRFLVAASPEMTLTGKGMSSEPEMTIAASSSSAFLFEEAASRVGHFTVDQKVHPRLPSGGALEPASGGSGISSLLHKGDNACMVNNDECGARDDSNLNIIRI